MAHALAAVAALGGSAAVLPLAVDAASGRTVARALSVDVPTAVLDVAALGGIAAVAALELAPDAAGGGIAAAGGTVALTPPLRLGHRRHHPKCRKRGANAFGRRTGIKIFIQPASGASKTGEFAFCIEELDVWCRVRSNGQD